MLNLEDSAWEVSIPAFMYELETSEQRPKSQPIAGSQLLKPAVEPTQLSLYLTSIFCMSLASSVHVLGWTTLNHCLVHSVPV